MIYPFSSIAQWSTEFHRPGCIKLVTNGTAILADIPWTGHCDLMEQLSDFGASARIKLSEVCAIFGFPGKFGVDGSKVLEMIDAGDVQGVRNYCETDVLNTYLIYLRFMLHRGNLSIEGYNRAVADIIAMIETEGIERHHLTEFMAAWDFACNSQFLL